MKSSNIVYQISTEDGQVLTCINTFKFSNKSRGYGWSNKETAEKYLEEVQKVQPNARISTVTREQFFEVNSKKKEMTEKEKIQDLLKKSKTKKEAAAKFGVHPDTLRKKMRSYGM